MFSVRTHCILSARARRSACSSRVCPRRCTSPRHPRRSGAASWSSRMPLPPIVSRARATDSRSRSAAMSLMRLGETSSAIGCVVVRTASASVWAMFATILTSFSWISWKPAIGRPNCWRRWAYSDAAAYAPSCMPAELQAMSARSERNARLMSRKLSMRGSRRSSGTSTPSRAMSALCTMRAAALCSMTLRRTPAASAGTTNASTRSPSASRATTTRLSEIAAVPDPALRAVDHPAVRGASGGRGHAARDVRPVIGFVEGEAPREREVQDAGIPRRRSAPGLPPAG